MPNQKNKSSSRSSVAATPTKLNGSAPQPSPRSYIIHVTTGYLLKTLVGSAALAFVVGRLSLGVFFKQSASADGGNAVKSRQLYTTLPPIVVSPTKEIPSTIYSSKHYEIAGVSTSDTLLVRGGETPEIKEYHEPFQQEEVAIDGTLGNDSFHDYVNHKDEQKIEGGMMHAPAGQHLLADIKSVDGEFLNSEERLAHAMVDLIELSGLTMLSYHCHGLPPVGVSCIGVLLESHISFHTWPRQGVITLDLFTCGPASLLPLLPFIRSLFGVPKLPAFPGDVVEDPFMQWAHKDRGFPALDFDGEENPEAVDVRQFLLGWIEFSMKDVVALEKTDWQEIEIFKVMSNRFGSLDSYKQSLLDDGSYYAQNPELFQPDRVIYLDGVMQSRLLGEAAYHEALVHPAMLSHSNPKRVAIIGGGEGATLREVLKHNTVETVTMIEIDEKMVKVCREFLPEWSDCSNLVGSAPSCFDDPRSEVIYADAIAWFIEKFRDVEKIDVNQRYDVIIVDALDPESTEFSDMLYVNDDFSASLANAMTEGGVLVSQMGISEQLRHPGSHLTKKLPEKLFKDSLMAGGFMEIMSYDETHGGFMAPWTYIIAFMDYYDSNWMLGEASIDLELRQRAVATNDGSDSPFRFFDGATMIGYQYPSRVREEIFCRAEPKPSFCDLGHGFDPERLSIPTIDFEVRPSAILNGGRGLHTKVDIPKGSYFALEESVHDMIVFPSTNDLIHMFNAAKEFGRRWEVVEAYLFAYGFDYDMVGGTAYSVDPGIFTFMNHGCNGTQVTTFPNLPKWAVTEMDVDPLFQDPEIYQSIFSNEENNIFVQRNWFLIVNSLDVASRDIKAGEEILDNYLNYYTEKNWETGVKFLQQQCANQAAGPVTQYERKQKPNAKATTTD